ncbi:MAG: metal ABC transporter permease [Bacilli bacterium]
MTINQFLSYFQYEFILRGLLVGLLVAVLASALGHFLVLKKMAYIGDGLAHVAYFAVAISITFFEQSLWFNLFIATIASLTIHLLVESNKGYSDSIIGGIATSAIALGTLIHTSNPNQNLRIEQFLFGSLLLLRQIDVVVIIVLFIIISALIVFFFEELKTMSFDRDFAKVNHLKPQWFQLGITVLTSWLVIIGIRATGSLLMSSFLLFPTLIMMNFQFGFKQSFVYGILIAIVNFIIGFALSLWFDLPTGSTLVVTYAIMWGLTVTMTSLQGRKRR